jgi:hypothetical protein
MKSNSPVYAPLDGRVHSFNNNTAHLDYGPAIILEHQTDGGERFYTLFGHLSPDSLEGLTVGMPVVKRAALCPDRRAADQRRLAAPSSLPDHPGHAR